MTSKKPKNRSLLRRSGRLRKTVYDTLNQTWLLGGYHDLFCSTVPPPSDSNGSSSRVIDELRRRDGGSRVVQKSDRRSGKVVSLHDRQPEHDSDDEETFDIYSRVKRRRRRSSVLHHDDFEGESHEESTTNSALGIMNISAPPSNNSTPKKEEQVESSSEDDIIGEDGLERRYCLRQQKAQTQRYETDLPVPRKKREESGKSAARNDFDGSAFRSPAHKRIKHDILRQARLRKLEHESSTSSSEADEQDDAERGFELRKAKSLNRSRSRFLPINMSPKIARTGVYRERTRVGASCTDLEPMILDNKMGFKDVGGLTKHVHSLKEMILFPFLYPEVFEKFKITPPRGVLFYGPPGTGKTLVARALANECSKNNRKVSFFMRKGADCLSKWVGESERQLRLLFDQAFMMRPSIIFFDEIDGLAPVRSSRQDQIHSSIVSTLLALMDGLDQRAEVIVIGATNRLDALDPALRRPGRFDRELCFSLPDLAARKQIFKIHTTDWDPPLPDEILNRLATLSVGYCGADIKGLCTEAALIALRKRYPQIYSSEKKLLLDSKSIQITLEDFQIGMQRLVPAIGRSVGPPSRQLSEYLSPLLNSVLSSVMRKIYSCFPDAVSSTNVTETTTTVDSVLNDLESQKLKFSHRILICADGAEHGQTNHMVPAVFHSLDHLPVFSLAVPQIFSASYRTAEEAVAEVLTSASKSGPCVLYLPAIDSWKNVVPISAWYTATSILESWHSNVSVLVVITANQNYNELEGDVKNLFARENVVELTPPTSIMRRRFFASLLLEESVKIPSVKPKRDEENLEIAPVEAPKPLSEKELIQYNKTGKSVLRQLRIFLREILNRLIRDRRFTLFSKPVDRDEVPDYFEIVKEPMDLSQMMTKIDQHKYQTVQEFLADIDLITRNALEYNPNRDLTDKMIRHRACALRDVANALIDDELDSDFEVQCKEMKEFRNTRGLDTSIIELPPAFIHLNPIDQQTLAQATANKVTNNNSAKCPESRKSSEKQQSNALRRRRNCDIWCRPKRKRSYSNRDKAAAIVQKYRARRHMKNKLLTNVGDSQPSSADSQQDDDDDDADDCSGKVENDGGSNVALNVSNDFLEEEWDGDDDVPLPEIPTLLADKAKLEKLLDSLVGRTNGFSVGRLEKIYGSLARIIDKYSDKYDRQQMINELEELITSSTSY